MVVLYKLISPIKINLNMIEKCDRPEMNRATRFKFVKGTSASFQNAGFLSFDVKFSFGSSFSILSLIGLLMVLEFLPIRNIRCFFLIFILYFQVLSLDSLAIIPYKLALKPYVSSSSFTSGHNSEYQYGSAGISIILG
ncbi:hypothetical protein C1646_665203 [Rhizophagus diaphanus]|nr:hypothetical protein C1646_665203 [Rhizophagus diaphanus] [Rhizophagus sp. MUCL 43196]